MPTLCSMDIYRNRTGTEESQLWLVVLLTAGLFPSISLLEYRLIKVKLTHRSTSARAIHTVPFHGAVPANKHVGHLPRVSRRAGCALRSTGAGRQGIKGHHGTEQENVSQDDKNYSPYLPQRLTGISCLLIIHHFQESSLCSAYGR